MAYFVQIEVEASAAFAQNCIPWASVKFTPQESLSPWRGVCMCTGIHQQQRAGVRSNKKDSGAIL
jgi:hypothetical protein